MTPRIAALLLVVAGSSVLSVGAALVYFPAGLIVAGIALVLIGLYLVDVEGTRESRPARPISPPL